MGKKKKKIKHPHYGALLKKAINKKGLKKIVVAKSLSISRPTLDSRIKDGLFDKEQKLKIDEIIS